MPHAVHFPLSTTATPSFTWMASNLQAFTHVPSPRQANAHSFCPPAEPRRRVTVVYAIVFVLFLCNTCRATAQNNRADRFIVGRRLAHYFGNARPLAVITNRASVHACLAADNRLGKVSTPRKTASAAVRPGRFSNTFSILSSLFTRNAIDAMPSSAPNKSPSPPKIARAVNTSPILLHPTRQILNPEKPINASAISPALTSAIGNPSIHFGGLEKSVRSRTPANNTIASVKPIAAEKPYTIALIKL